MLRQILTELLEDIRKFNGWSTAIGSPYILYHISVLTNGNLERLNTIFNPLKTRINLGNIPADNRMVILTHYLRIVLLMLNKMSDQFSTISLSDIQVTRLLYFTLLDPPRYLYWSFTNAWLYMHNRYDPLGYNNGVIDNLRESIHVNATLTYTQTRMFRIIEYILSKLLG